jgi:predicted metalloprotease with PDZ domain
MNRAQWPQARVVVRVCGSAARPSQDGRFEVFVAVGVCDVFAQRRDGLFFASSEVITLDVEAGVEQEVELWLPDYRQGGVGMGIVEHEEGVLIERVLGGGAAAEAGLQPGDVVLEVDGVPAAALSLEEFVQVTTGEAGTEVELIISRGEGSDREESVYLLDRRVME